MARQQAKPALKARANAGVEIRVASATPSSSRRRRLSMRRDSPRKDHEDSEKRPRASARLISRRLRQAADAGDALQVGGEAVVGAVGDIVDAPVGARGDPAARHAVGEILDMDAVARRRLLAEIAGSDRGAAARAAGGQGRRFRRPAECTRTRRAPRPSRAARSRPRAAGRRAASAARAACPRSRARRHDRRRRRWCSGRRGAPGRPSTAARKRSRRASRAACRRRRDHVIDDAPSTSIAGAAQIQVERHGFGAGGRDRLEALGPRRGTPGRAAARAPQRRQRAAAITATDDRDLPHDYVPTNVEESRCA